MPTLSLELTATWNESLARRNLGDRYYAGLPAKGFLQTVTSLAQGVESSLPIPPNSLPITSILVAADPDTNIVVGWVNGGVVYELAVNEVTIVTPPAGVVPYLKNTAAVGTPIVPVKTLIIY